MKFTYDCSPCFLAEGNLPEQLNSSRKKMSLSLVVVAVLISGIFLACIICFYIRRRKMAKRRGNLVYNFIFNSGNYFPIISFHFRCIVFIVVHSMHETVRVCSVPLLNARMRK